MTLLQIIDTLKAIALTQHNIRTATDGDIYEALNGNLSVKYGAFHVNQTSHQTTENTDVYGLNLFFVDRLEDDDSNRLQIQSIGKTVLDNIVRAFCEQFDADIPTITYSPFTQRFTDMTAGVFATVTLTVFKEWSCAEGESFITPLTINNQDITVTENGVYVPSEGFTGFGKVNIHIPIPVIKESVSLNLMAGETGVYRPEAPYDGVAEVVYEVEPQQGKILEVTENGNYTVVPDYGYGGMGFVEVNVNVPDLNGSYAEGYDAGHTEGYGTGFAVGYEKGEDDGYQKGVDEGVAGLPTLDITENGVYDQPNKGVNVNVTPKINMEAEGIKFAYSTTKEIPDWCDWTNITSFERMFYWAKNISTIPLIDTSNVKSFESAFEYSNIKTVALLDTSNATSFRGIFAACSITEIPLFDTSNVTDFNNAFYNCSKLKTLPPFNTSKATNFNCTFSSSSLESLPAYDCSSIGVSYGATHFFGYSQLPKLTELGGFINIKTSIENYAFTQLPNLTYQSCINVLNGLYDFTGNGEPPTSNQGKIKLHPNFLTTVGDEISIALEKGWTVST